MPSGFYQVPVVCETVRIVSMAKLTLVYGMRLLPSEEVAEVGEGTVKLRERPRGPRGSAHLEGSKEDIEKQLRTASKRFSISIRRFDSCQWPSGQ